MSVARRLLPLCALAIAGMLPAVQVQAQGKPAQDTPPPPIVPALPSVESLGPPDAARGALGRKLADMLNGEAVTRQQFNRLVNQTLPNQILQDAEVAEAEKRYPGLVQHMVEAMRPHLEKRTFALIPVLVDRIGDLYARQMDQEAIEDAIAFYGSDSGQAVVQEVAQNGDVAALMKEAAQTSQMSEATIKRTLADNASGAIDSLSHGDRLELVRFAVSRAGRMMTRANQQVPAILASLAGHGTKDDDPTLEAATRQAVAEYVEQYEATHMKDKAAPAPQADPRSKDKQHG